MPFPPGWGDDTLSEHMGKAINNARATFANIKPQYERFIPVDHSFPVIYNNLPYNDLSAFCDNWPNPWNNLPNSQVLWPAIFMMRAHSGYRTACQLAMSGQITESVPVLRSCLEYSLYALHMNKDKAALEAWNKQYGNYSPSKPISRIFCTRNLKNTLKKFDLKLSPVINDLYQLTINFGGHPNKMAIDLNLTFTQDDKNHKIKAKLLHGDPAIIELGMAFTTEVGFACLLIFKNIFPTIFKDHGVNVTVEVFEQNLPNRQKLYEDFLTK